MAKDEANTAGQPALTSHVAPKYAQRRKLTPAAERALAEAAERRQQSDEAETRPRELNGRGGAEPVRYGDWEVKGLASDF